MVKIITLHEGSRCINKVFADFIEDALSSDQVEFHSDKDVPSFSDAEAMILVMDLSPYNGFYFSSESWGVKVRKLRREYQGWNNVIVFRCIGPLHPKTP